MTLYSLMLGMLAAENKAYPLTVTDQRTCSRRGFPRTGFDLEPSPYHGFFLSTRSGPALAEPCRDMATVNNLGGNDLVTPSQIAFYEARARGELAR